MSKVFNMVGGGGGATASISVTGLSETDTVTASNGSKIVTGIFNSRQIVTETQVPVMTSNTTPSGVCSASGSRSGNPPYFAFNGNGNPWVVDSKPTASNPQWIQYMFNEPVCVTSMMYYHTANDNSRVRNCVVQRSDDGINFVDVYQTDIPTSPAEVTIEFNNSVYAKYWRLKILSNNGNPQNVYAGELQFYGTKCSVVAEHYISPIKNLGTWTVSATNGVSTATQDVLVDAITSYEITMSLTT